jgi:hypothetical protein
MTYTVSHNGRPVGISDLAFARVGGPARVGWFHPTVYGERLMPLITGPVPGITIRRDLERVDAHAPPPQASPLPESTPDADLAEFLQHVESFELTLHRDDGTLIETELIGIQDTQRLLELGEELEADEVTLDNDHVEVFDPCDPPDADELAADVEAMLDSFDDDDPWDANGEPDDLPRYLLIVELVDESDIP